MNPVKVTDLDMTFGGGPDGMTKLLPKYEEIPEEFRNGNNPFCKLVVQWFFYGLKASSIRIKPEFDENEALRHLKTIMGSFAPKHEHKMAGVAYLMSQWFDIV